MKSLFQSIHQRFNKDAKSRAENAPRSASASPPRRSWLGADDSSNEERSRKSKHRSLGSSGMGSVSPPPPPPPRPPKNNANSSSNNAPKSRRRRRMSRSPTFQQYGRGDNVGAGMSGRSRLARIAILEKLPSYFTGKINERILCSGGDNAVVDASTVTQTLGVSVTANISFVDSEKDDADSVDKETVDVLSTLYCEDLFDGSVPDQDLVDLARALAQTILLVMRMDISSFGRESEEVNDEDGSSIVARDFRKCMQTAVRVLGQLSALKDVVVGLVGERYRPLFRFSDDTESVDTDYSDDSTEGGSRGLQHALSSASGGEINANDAPQEDAILLLKLMECVAATGLDDRLAFLRSELCGVVDFIVNGSYFSEALAELVSPIIGPMVRNVRTNVYALGSDSEAAVRQSTVDSIRVAVSMITSSMEVMDSMEAVWAEFEAAMPYHLLHLMICKLPAFAAELLAIVRRLVNLGKGYKESVIISSDRSLGSSSAAADVYLSRNEKAFAVIANLLVQICPTIKGKEKVSLRIMETRNMSWKLINEGSAGSALPRDDAVTIDKQSLRLPLLHSILAVYSSNTENFGFIDDRFRIMSHLAIALSQPAALHDEFLYMVVKLIELVAMGMDYRPKDVLLALSETTLPILWSSVVGAADEEHRARYRFGLDLVWNTITKLIRSDSEYKDIMRDCGLIGGPLNDFLFSVRRNPSSASLDVVPLLCSLLRDMVRGNLKNETQFRDCGIDKVLIQFATCEIPGLNLPSETLDVALNVSGLSIRGMHPTHASLAVLLQTARDDSRYIKTDMAEFVDILMRDDQSSLNAQLLTIEVVALYFDSNDKSYDLWRDAGGYEALLGILSRLKGCFSSTNAAAEGDHASVYKLISRCVILIGISLRGSQGRNKAYLSEQVGFAQLASALDESGVFASWYASQLIDTIVDLGLEKPTAFRSIESRLSVDTSCSVFDVDTVSDMITNVSILEILFSRLDSLSPNALIHLLERLVVLLENDAPPSLTNCEVLCKINAPSMLMDRFTSNVILPGEDAAVMPEELKNLILDFVTKIGQHQLSPDMMLQLVRLLYFRLPGVMEAGAQVLSDISRLHGSRACPSGKYINLQSSDIDPMYVHVAGLPSRMSPPPSCYTVSMWIWDDRRSLNKFHHRSASSGVGFATPSRVSVDGRTSPGRNILEPENEEITLLTLRAADGRQALQIILQSDRCICVKTSSGSVAKKRGATPSGRAIFSEFCVQKRTWHHLMLVHKRERSIATPFLSSEKKHAGTITFFADGKEVQSAKLPYFTTPASTAAGTQASVHIGSGPYAKEAYNISNAASSAKDRAGATRTGAIRFGPTLMVKEALLSTHACNFYARGPGYIGCLAAGADENSNDISTTLVCLYQRLARGYASTAQEGESGLHLLDTPDIVKSSKRSPSRRGLASPRLASKRFCQSRDSPSFGLSRKFAVLSSIDPKAPEATIEFIKRALRSKIDPMNIVFFIYAGPAGGRAGTDGKSDRGSDYYAAIKVRHSVVRLPSPVVLSVGDVVVVSPAPLQNAIRGVGGVACLLPALRKAIENNSDGGVILLLRTIRELLFAQDYNLSLFRDHRGYSALAWVLHTPKAISDGGKAGGYQVSLLAFEKLLSLASAGTGTHAVLTDPDMLKNVLLNHHVWRKPLWVSEDAQERVESSQREWRLTTSLFSWLANLVDPSNINRALNYKALDTVDLVDWVLKMLLLFCSDCPDSSHLDQRDAPRFTGAVLDELTKRGVLPAP